MKPAPSRAASDMSSPANAIIQHGTVDVDGVWQRHVPARFKDSALEGRIAPSRWGSGTSFPLLHLGQPRDSVIIEAYRHIIDPVENPELASQIIPRRLVTCDVAVSNIFDLRTAAGRVAAGLTIETLTSATSDRVAYNQCRQTASLMHQVGLHGLIAPAATGMGSTLVLFTTLLPAEERPRRVGEDELWDQLPADPRERRGRLTLVSDPPAE